MMHGHVGGQEGALQEQPEYCTSRGSHPTSVGPGTLAKMHCRHKNKSRYVYEIITK